MTDADLSKAHAKVREILTHHDVKNVHTALVADLIYVIEDIIAPKVGCLRCNTPKKCAIWGCVPGTFPPEPKG